MLDRNTYPKIEYTTCEDYQESQVIVRKDLDLRKALKDVSFSYEVLNPSETVMIFKVCGSPNLKGDVF